MAVGALAVAASLALAGSASAASDHRTVKILDDCETTSFDAAIGPGTCVGDGRTAFGDFIAEFQATGAVDDWEFKPDDFKLRKGGRITAVNRGGETHTFTEVPKFGNGCIDLLNDPEGGPPVVDCSLLATTAVASGGKRVVFGLHKGVHRFECLIHPWMRSTVKVEGHRHGGHGGHGNDD